MKHEFLLLLAVCACLLVGSARADFSLQEGDYYTSKAFSLKISQYSPAGVLTGALTLSNTYGQSVRGTQFLRGALYAVTENGSGFNVLRINADLSIEVLWHDIPTYVGGSIGYGKMATNGASLFVAGQNVLLRFDLGSPSPTQIFTGNQVKDVKVLPSGNLLVATAYTLQEITTSGVSVRQITPVGVSLADVQGVEYDAATDSIYVTELNAPNILRLDAATGAVEKSVNRSYAMDLFFTHDGNLLVGGRSAPATLFDADLNVLRALGTEDQAFVTEYVPRTPPPGGITFSFTQQVNYVMTDVPDTEVLVGDIIVGHYTFDPLTPGEPYVGSTTSISRVYPGAITSWEATFVRLGITVTGRGGYIQIGNDTAFVNSDTYTAILLPDSTPIVRFPSGRQIGYLNVQIVDIERRNDDFLPADMFADASLPLDTSWVERASPSYLDGHGRFKGLTDQFQTRLLDLKLVPPPSPTPTPSPAPTSTPKPSTDRKKPELVVYGGLRRTTARSTLLVGGRASDNVRVTSLGIRKSNGRYEAIPVGKYWATTLDLKAGRNVFVIRAADAAGNTRQVRLTITRRTN